MQVYPPITTNCPHCGKAMTFNMKQINKMKEMLSKGKTFREVAEKYGVDPGTINWFVKKA